ncbi:MAG: tRNA pseudouridine(38-40) synthase TruA [Lachnospiraceae bacterium]|nr:tRNA pseudouridine(38-40) synthase TruA [Lachnospiraceae bacterium]
MEGLRRIKLTLAYDGTNYCGWQVQPNGMSIQEMLQKHIEALTGEKIMLTGASRTDSGVHALGQVAVFDTAKIWPAERFVPALNQRLPKDIVIQSAEEVSLEFHPRYQNTLKTYEYRILNRRVSLPNERLNSYWVPQKLDVEAMKVAASELLGTHDFHNFCSMKTKVTDTVRTITDVQLFQKNDMIYFRITGNGFLYNMVRIIVGALLKAGFHKKTAEDICRSLECEERLVVGPTAPDHGLTLVNIEYLDHF